MTCDCLELECPECNPPDNPPWWAEACFRTSGDMTCPECGQTWYKHPQPAKEECPSLVRGCDGKLRKL